MKVEDARSPATKVLEDHPSGLTLTSRNVEILLARQLSALFMQVSKRHSVSPWLLRPRKGQTLGDALDLDPTSIRKRAVLGSQGLWRQCVSLTRLVIKISRRRHFKGAAMIVRFMHVAVIGLALLLSPTIAFAGENPVLGTWKLKSFVREVTATGEKINQKGRTSQRLS
jgi:hypothetical protein